MQGMSKADARAMGEAEDLVPRLEACTTDAEVLEVMTGASYNAFRLLDEKPGYFSVEIDGRRVSYTRANWHRNLRVVRNTPALDLFDRLTR